MIIDFNRYNGGGGSGSGVTPQDVQRQIDSALTPYWDSAITESAITEAVEGKADAKTIVDFDHTSQSERAALYATLKTFYDGGSGATINKNYDFYKTVNTWQGLKIDYYGFSGDTMVFGKVVSPENSEDQVVYEQVMTIDSAGNVNVVTNTVGGGADMSGYWNSAETKTYVDSGDTALQSQIDTMDEVVSEALVDLNERIDEISGSSVDLSGYYTSAQTEDAISAATAGKADAANVSANTNAKLFPYWNEQGVITGRDSQQVYDMNININGTNNAILRTNIGNIGPIYGPTAAGTAGDILVSTGNGAPVWSAMTIPTPDVDKAYVDSAITQVQDQLDLIDEVIPAAIVDLNEKKVESQDIKHIVKLTQAAYNQLSVKDPETFYIIVNE